MFLFHSLQDHSLETQEMLQSCKTAVEIMKKMDLRKWTLRAITHQHVQCLLEQVEVLVTGPFCLPRYFFQILQSTSVKVS